MIKLLYNIKKMIYDLRVWRYGFVMQRSVRATDIEMVRRYDVFNSSNVRVHTIYVIIIFKDKW